MNCIHFKRNRQSAEPRSTVSNATTAPSSLQTFTSTVSNATTAPSSLQTFTLQELLFATNDFHDANVIGEGRYGKVYVGNLDCGRSVAVERLNGRNDATALTSLQHPHIVNLVGCCFHGEKINVYEKMTGGNLEVLLFDDRRGEGEGEGGRLYMKWSTRMKIAQGTAKGLAYLHDSGYSPALTSAKILLDSKLNPKFSDYRCTVKFNSTLFRVSNLDELAAETYSYYAPEYTSTGHLTLKSDIFGFGLLLLEIITGRKAFDSRRKDGEQSILTWSSPLLNDSKRFSELVDPLLCNCYPRAALEKMIGIISSCLNSDPDVRPSSAEVMASLNQLLKA